MDSLYSWTDTTKLGVALTGLGVFFTFMGVVMLLDSILLTMGNVFFVVGVALVMGPTRCKTFFIARQRASTCFFLGILLVLLRWCFVGLCVQGFGALNLFGNFFPVVARVLESVPVVGPFLLSAPVQRLLALLHLQDGRNLRNV
ncbi:Got1/Sft2-like family [Novymonas esmeraldas]|uniref:Got1/Sft2-like family n=1 Tax=Novymonas esmeraldas TaxID=1808958 RepID=A0AAW0EYZ7_9TRYP